MSSLDSSAVDQEYRQERIGVGRRLVNTLAAVERQLWALVVLALLADVALTYYGLQVGLREGNPAMRLAIDTAGIFALVAVKLLVVGAGATLRRFLDERGAVVPLGLALPWVAAVVINTGLLL